MAGRGPELTAILTAPVVCGEQNVGGSAALGPPHLFTKHATSPHL